MRLNANNIEERIKNTFIETLHIKFVESDDVMSLEAIMPVKKEFTQTLGVLHGGATISLAESVAGVGSNNICGYNERSFGMQISASHISKAEEGDTVHAKGIIIHRGRTTHIWDVSVFSEKTGKLISSVRVTNIIVKK